jgi:Lrp/AsnC family transcriptional regulator, leucine-responsive regulatory protein
MKAELDRIDVKLVQGLQDAARISNQDLAEQVGLSPSACLARVRRLEQDGVIRRYLADVAIARLGSSLEVFAEVTLSNHTPGDFRHFELTAARIPEIVEMFQLSGAFDYLLHVVCRDMTHYRELNDALTNGKHGVEKVVSHVVMAESKPFSGYPIRSIVPADAPA